MTDRVIVYPGQIPQVEHVLESNRNMQDAISSVLRLTMNSQGVAGFDATPNSPAGMSVVLSAGTLCTSAPVDPSAYSTLASDSTSIFKAASYAGGTITGFTAPGTTGQTRKIIIHASFQETDTTAAQLPYYDSVTGQSTLGASQNTRRIQRAVVGITSGSSTTTGNETIPATPAGAIPLYVVTLTYGQSTITAAHIERHPNNLFVPYDLMDLKTAIRPKLTADLMTYVSPSGNNSNDGLSARTPKLTVQNVIDTASKTYDFNGFHCIINCAAGTYTVGAAFVNKPLGGTGQFDWVVQGNETTPSNVVFNVANGNCFVAAYGAGVQIRGVRMLATGTPTVYNSIGYGILAFGSAYVDTYACDFGACGHTHVNAADGSIVNFASTNYRISGGSQYHAVATGSGRVLNVVTTVTVSAAVTFGGAFVCATTGGNVVIYSNTFTNPGNVSGKRYSAESCGNIQVNGNSATYLPGSVAGTSVTGGNYY
ncbi:hypothetical protein [Teichococcus deserti]|uniref:hypothetical protein n=1 Tax=Teichococcus deserti TaxID=1817963 RepID=UPI0010544C0C|nr:hypothetical protein [Pseudoroseomonas deserti]